MRSPTPTYSFHKWRNDHGGTLVEFAIVLPLLLILVFGIIEFSIILHNKSILTNATREGARAGVSYDFETSSFPDKDFVKTVVVDYCKNRLIPNNNQITKENVDYDEVLSDPHRLIIKIKNFNHSFLTFNFLSLENPIPLRAETVMVFLSPET